MEIKYKIPMVHHRSIKDVMGYREKRFFTFEQQYDKIKPTWVCFQGKKVLYGGRGSGGGGRRVYPRVLKDVRPQKTKAAFLRAL